MKRILLIFTVYLFASHAYADGVIRAGVGYLINEISSGGTTTKTTRQNIDIAGGYRGDSGWALLGQYAIGKITTATTPGSTVNGNRTSYGVGGGWITREMTGAYLTGIYYLSSEYEQQGTTYKGKGYQVDAGLKMNVSRLCMILGLAYENYTYDKISTGTLTTPRKETHLGPRVGIEIDF